MDAVPKVLAGAKGARPLPGSGELSLDRVSREVSLGERKLFAKEFALLRVLAAQPLATSRRSGSCTPTASTTIGSTCSLQTTVDALYPGAIKETRRSIWQLGQVQVLDGGSDDLASTTADNTLFMVQGVFAP